MTKTILHFTLVGTLLVATVFAMGFSLTVSRQIDAAQGELSTLRQTVEAVATQSGPDEGYGRIGSGIADARATAAEARVVAEKVDRAVDKANRMLDELESGQLSVEVSGLPLGQKLTIRLKRR